MDYSGYHWRQVEPEGKHHVWQRDTDEVEHMYTALARQYRGTGRSFFHITGALSLKIPSSHFASLDDADRALKDALSRAWVSLRKKHPTIASQTKYDPARETWIKEYRSDMRGWGEKTLVFVDGRQTGAEFANSDPPAPDLPTLFVLSPALPTDEGVWIRRDLILRSPHDIIDGIGTLYLLNNFAELASEALAKGDTFVVDNMNSQGEEEARLSPAYRIAADVPRDTSDLVMKRLKTPSYQAKAASNLKNGAEPVGFPYTKGALLPGKHQRVEIVLSQEETASIISASKKLGATVTHVFHAAIAIVLRDMQEKTTDAPRNVRYVNYILRNERASCKPPYNDGKLHPAGVYHSVSSQTLVVDMTIKPESEISNVSEEKREAFLRALDIMRDHYQAVRDDKEHYALTPTIFARGIPRLPTPTSEPENLPVPPPQELAAVSISSMGRIDTIMPPRHGSIELFSPWVTGEELKNGIGTFLGTFRGELAFSAAYNDAWNDKEKIVTFLEDCLTVVKTGLEVNNAK
jgi:hypothetical protein